jgi:microcystin-dependent protein
MEGYIGEIRLFAGDFAPKSWAFCQGQILAIAQNTALFSIIGTYYGGNGVTTMALPDLRGRVPIGPGQGPGLPNVDMGEVSGSHDVTLITDNLPQHSHSVTVNDNTTGMATTGSGNYLNSKTESGESVTASGPPSSPAVLNPATIGNTGGNQPFSIMQPYLGLNYIICLYGIFPSRN